MYFKNIILKEIKWDEIQFCFVLKKVCINKYKLSNCNKWLLYWKNRDYRFTTCLPECRLSFFKSFCINPFLIDKLSPPIILLELSHYSSLAQWDLLRLRSLQECPITVWYLFSQVILLTCQTITSFASSLYWVIQGKQSFTDPWASNWRAPAVDFGLGDIWQGTRAVHHKSNVWKKMYIFFNWVSLGPVESMGWSTNQPESNGLP